MNKKLSEKLWLIISLIIIMAGLLIYYLENKDHRTFIKCESLVGVNFDSGIYAFDKKYFYKDWITNKGLFLFKKRVEKLDEYQGIYYGILNEEYNTRDVKFDRIKGQLQFGSINKDEWKNKLYCEKIKKPKVKKIKKKF